MSQRWDETWHRLREWTNGQGPSERLAGLVLSAAGYEEVDPSHPLGGPDGGKDAIVSRGGHQWVMAVYFPRGQQSFGDIKIKLEADFAGVARNRAHGLAFVTNQELRLAEREALRESVAASLDLIHLERLVHILDQPGMSAIRRQFLGLGDVVSRAAPDVTPVSYMDDKLFVARERELNEIRAFLKPDGDGSVYVISGLPGGGKTALAQQAAATALGEGWFGGGGYSVDMRGYALDVESAVQGQDVYAGALRALGVNVASDEAERSALYHTLLNELDASNRPVLILLDNVSAASQITPLLPHTRRHRVLVTSRNEIMPLLPNASGEVLSPLTEVASKRVIELVCKTAGRPLPEDHDSLTSLAGLCAHLPLALRVAAAILVFDRSSSVGDLCEELADETQRLEILQYEDTAVRAVLRTSYTRLAATESQCFRLLSLHPGPEFSTPAGASLLNVKEVDARRVLRRLATCHLVESAGKGRWRMHDLIRLCGVELAAEHDASADRRAAQVRVIGHYADAASDATRWFNATADGGLFKTRASAMEWLQREGPTAVAAAHLAAAIDEPGGAWLLGMNLLPYLEIRRDFATALPLLEAARLGAVTLGDAEGEAGALNNIGLTLTSVGKLNDAATRFREGLAIARKSGCLDEQASLLVSFAALRRRQRGPRAGQLLLEEAADIRRRVGDKHGLAFVLTNLGISLREGGAFAQAIPILRDALLLHQEGGARRAEASTLTHLATALAQQDQFEEALPIFGQAIRAAEEIHDMSGLASACMNLGLGYRHAGRTQDALDAFGRAQAALDDTDDTAVRWVLNVNIAQTWQELGDRETAQRYEELARALSPT